MRGAEYAKVTVVIAAIVTLVMALDAVSARLRRGRAHRGPRRRAGERRSHPTERELTWTSPTPPPSPPAFASGDGDEPDRREGVVLAKATWQYTPAGALSLDVAKPFPLFDNDERSPFGIIPRDDLPRGEEGFEVIFLGSAHAPRGSAVTEMTVSLRVGEVERSLCVVGDRVVRDGVIAAPQPFTTMDLGWSNAFGGAAEVLVDRDAPVIVSDVRNPAGKGFDPAPQAFALCEALKAPKGYPVILGGARVLPNVEHPSHRITSPSDAPEPVSWAHAVDVFRGSRDARDGPRGLAARGHPGAHAAGVFTARWTSGSSTAPRRARRWRCAVMDPEGTVRFALPADAGGV
jgi:hypothetical protein